MLARVRTHTLFTGHWSERERARERKKEREEEREKKEGGRERERGRESCMLTIEMMLTD